MPPPPTTTAAAAAAQPASARGRPGAILLMRQVLLAMMPCTAAQELSAGQWRTMGGRASCRRWSRSGGRVPCFVNWPGRLRSPIGTRCQRGQCTATRGEGLLIARVQSTLASVGWCSGCSWSSPRQRSLPASHTARLWGGTRLQAPPTRAAMALAGWLMDAASSEPIAVSRQQRRRQQRPRPPPQPLACAMLRCSPWARPAHLPAAGTPQLPRMCSARAAAASKPGARHPRSRPARLRCSGRCRTGWAPSAPLCSSRCRDCTGRWPASPASWRPWRCCCWRPTAPWAAASTVAPSSGKRLACGAVAPARGPAAALRNAAALHLGNTAGSITPCRLPRPACRSGVVLTGTVLGGAIVSGGGACTAGAWRRGAPCTRCRLSLCIELAGPLCVVPMRLWVQVSLAYLAKGSAVPLINYLPEQYTSVGAWPQAEVAELKANLTYIMTNNLVGSLPPQQQQLVRCWGRGRRRASLHVHGVGYSACSPVPRRYRPLPRWHRVTGLRCRPLAPRPSAAAAAAGADADCHGGPIKLRPWLLGPAHCPDDHHHGPSVGRARARHRAGCGMGRPCSAAAGGGRRGRCTAHTHCLPPQIPTPAPCPLLLLAPQASP